MNYIQWNTEKLQLQTGVLDTKEKNDISMILHSD